MESEEYNPCISCGACCGFYRASFYWAETDAADGGTVPAGMTEKLNDFRSVMKGTNQPKPRCIALVGEIGVAVRCSIYEQRASVCRDFKLSYENGVHNPGCDKARAVYGLSPLEPFTNQPEASPEEPKPNKGPGKGPNLPMAA